jgi:GH35 family endo-1,4-beta-xylanase
MLAVITLAFAALLCFGFPTPVPTDKPLAAGPAPDALAMTNGQGVGTSEIVSVEGQPFSRAVRIASPARQPFPWDIQLAGTTAAAVKQGDTLLAVFFARGVEVQPETGSAASEFVFERNADPHDKSLDFPLEFTRQWTEYRLAFRAHESFDAGKAQYAFRAGGAKQSFEIGDFRIINLGPDIDLNSIDQTRVSYPGREPDAAWRAQALERIERIRKAELRIRVVDASGKPVPDARVSIHQTRNAFHFGTAVAADHLVKPGADGDQYRQVMLDHFNAVVIENHLKWPYYESWGRDDANKALGWLTDKGLMLRGHVLVWPSWQNSPADLRDLAADPAALRKRINDHITAMVTLTQGRAHHWDVINETYANHDLIDILGRDAMVEWFHVARAADPDVRLYYNDYTMLSGGGTNVAARDHFYDTVKFLKDSGAPIDGFGEQAHFGQNVVPPVQVLQHLDRFQTIGLPMMITEFDVNTPDDHLQADYTRDFLIACYSHPMVEGFMKWGFWQGRHWMANAAIYRLDWSERPAVGVWRDLTQNQWMTRADLTTDAQGQTSVRGHHGHYTITVTKGDLTQSIETTLDKNGATVEVTME